MSVVFAGSSRAQTALPSRQSPQLVLQIEHVAAVTALAASPDGKVFASASADRTAKVWDIQTGKLLLSLPHSAIVQAIAFRDTTTLVCASADGSVRSWDVTSGGLRSVQSGGAVNCTATALSRDGMLAAFAFDTGKIAMRQTVTNTLVASAEGHPTAITAMAFSPDGKLLATASEAFREKPADEEVARRAGDVRIWDVDTGELERVLRGHALSVRGVAWSPEGNRLASVGESGTAVLWDAQTFGRLNEFNISAGQGRALVLAFSPDGKSLVTGWRGGVQSWDVSSAKQLWTLAGDDAVSSALFVSESVLATGGRDGTLRLLAARDGVQSAIHGRVAPVAAVRVSPDAKTIASVNGNGAVCLWNAQLGTLQRAWRGHVGVASAIAFSPDSAQIATAGHDGAVRLWAISTGKLLRTWREFAGAVGAVAFSRDGKTLAIGTSSGKYGGVSLWDTANGSWKQTLADVNGQIHSLAFSTDGTLAAASGRGASWGQIVVWDGAFKVQSREFLRGAHAVAFSGDGKKRAVGGAWLDETEDFAAAGDVMQIWNARAAEKTKEVTTQAPGARILDIAWSADAKTSATASADGAIRLLDADGVRKTLRGHIGAAQSISFLSPESGQLVSAGRDGTIRVWNSVTGRLHATLLTLRPVKETAAIGETLALDWLALTPEGFFDSSPGASRVVQWRLGADVFPVEAFERAFRNPAAIKAAMIGDDAINLKGVAFAAGSQIPPSVSIVMPKAGASAGSAVAVTIAASDDKDLRSVQLWINGRPAGSRQIDAGAKPLEIGAKALEMGAKALELGAKPLEIGAKPIPSQHLLNWTVTVPATVPPPDGAGVTVKAIVTDGDGLQGTDEIRLARNGVGAGGTLHVLSVGVSEYANPAFNLKYAAADATTFASLWTDARGKLFDKVNAVTLADSRATSTAVKAAMENIARVAGPDDVVAIFLSGHGAQRNADEFFFATTDVRLDNLAATTVPWTVFQDSLAASKARRVVLFLDACHSGGALGGRQASNENMAEQLVQNAGAVVFASSLGSQQSFELDAVKHGAFTQALIEGIREGKADLDAGAGRDGIVNVEELLTFLRARIPQLTEGAQMPACPLLRDFGEPFPLAKIKE